MGFIKEFKDFAVRGNVVDMAVGIIIGGAFGKIVTSFVNDIIMPPIGYLLGGTNFSDLKAILSPEQTEIIDGVATVIKPEAAISYGLFIQSVIDFLIIALCIFAMIKAINKAKKKKEEAPAAPAAPAPDVVLLEEIRDLLKKEH